MTTGKKSRLVGSSTLHLGLLGAALATSVFASPTGAVNIYVSTTGAGAMDGTSPANAYGQIEQALNQAWTTAGSHTIHLAAGTYSGTTQIGDDFFTSGALSFREAGTRSASSITFLGAGVGVTDISSTSTTANFGGGPVRPFFVIDNIGNYENITFKDLSIDASGGDVASFIAFGEGAAVSPNSLGWTFNNVTLDLGTRRLMLIDNAASPAAAYAITATNGTVIDTTQPLGNLRLIGLGDALATAPVADIVVLDLSSSVTRSGGPLLLTDIAMDITDGSELGNVYLNGYNGLELINGYNGGTDDVLAYDGSYFVSQIIPEPTSILMLGLSGLLLPRRRR